MSPRQPVSFGFWLAWDPPSKVRTNEISWQKLVGETTGNCQQCLAQSRKAFRSRSASRFSCFSDTPVSPSNAWLPTESGVSSYGTRHLLRPAEDG